MAINFGALLRYAPAAAQGLGAYRKGAMAGEMQREAQERADAAALFEQFAKRRQLEQTDRTINQREELRSMQDAASLERERMRAEAANLRNQLDNATRERTTGMTVGGRKDVAGMQYGEGGQGDRDNAAAMQRAMLAYQAALARIAAQGQGGGVQPRPRVVPQGVVQSYENNRRQLRVIDEALGELERKPNAVGFKAKFVPDMILDRAQPGGVRTRAAIHDIGSLEIRDRSGAAVTASEFPRLRPFIPNPGDDAATIRMKLQRMRQIIEEETEGLASHYTEEQGYTPLKVDKPMSFEEALARARQGRKP